MRLGYQSEEQGMRNASGMIGLDRLSPLWSRNPLVRRVDRWESLAMVVLVGIALAFIAVAGAVGTSQYDARSRTYAEDAKASRTVTATAIEDSDVIVQPNAIVTVVTARWNAAGINHVGEFAYPQRLKAGDEFTIWVDAHGRRIARPPSQARAVNEASGIAFSSWLAVATTTVALGYGLHRRLDRRRFAQWERELSLLAGEDGNRTNNKP